MVPFLDQNDTPAGLATALPRFCTSVRGSTAPFRSWTRYYARRHVPGPNDTPAVEKDGREHPPARWPKRLDSGESPCFVFMMSTRWILCFGDTNFSKRVFLDGVPRVPGAIWWGVPHLCFLPFSEKNKSVACWQGLVFLGKYG